MGGLEVLDAMEDVPTDSSDKPITAIEIKTVDIVVNPISEAVETEQSRLEEAERVQSNARAARRAAALGQRPKIDSSPVSEKLENLKNGSTFAGPTDGVGKYLTKLAAKGLDDVNSALNTNQTEQTNVMTEKKSKLHDRRPALPRKTVFRDFSGW